MKPTTMTLLCLHFLLATAIDDFEGWIDDAVRRYEDQSAFIMNADVTRPALDGAVRDVEAKRTVITVRKDGAGDFKTITGAVRSIATGNWSRTIVKIGPGVYREKVTVDRARPYVTFYGDPKNPPRIAYGATARKVGTWSSATVIVESDHFVAANVIFENSAPRPKDGELGGQASALRISGDMAAFYNCKFLGYQDTLCDDVGRHYFNNCYMRGTVDFIFGNGKSLYEDCHMESVAKGVTAITAQARMTPTEHSGFSFVRCSINGTGNATLSRAWKQSSRVVFLYTYMGRLIQPAGWDDKGNKSRDKTVFYGEYKCSGPGANTDKRVRYSRLLTDTQAQPFLSKSFINADLWLSPPPNFILK
ncbi:putative pectinesterase 63 [Acorus gramineus]|uniref:pectinesterase n=1 Tax=Acorus gramineus TaxID=55184 RepID=A0AAV9BW76_ACOGR|nr:putative pectinesterase 63 [Acorus gramineus]